MKVLGLTVATFEVPEHGLTLEGEEVSGVLFKLPEISQDRLDELVAQAEAKLEETSERAQAALAGFGSRMAEALARALSLFVKFPL